MSKQNHIDGMSSSLTNRTVVLLFIDVMLHQMKDTTLVCSPYFAVFHNVSLNGYYPYWKFLPVT